MHESAQWWSAGQSFVARYLSTVGITSQIRINLWTGEHYHVRVIPYMPINAKMGDQIQWLVIDQTTGNALVINQVDIKNCF